MDKIVEQDLCIKLRNSSDREILLVFFILFYRTHRFFVVE